MSLSSERPCHTWEKLPEVGILQCSVHLSEREGDRRWGVSGNEPVQPRAVAVYPGMEQAHEYWFKEGGGGDS